MPRTEESRHHRERLSDGSVRLDQTMCSEHRKECSAS